MDFKIERGIPSPAPPPNRKIYPFAEMEIGDSFAVPIEMHAQAVTAASWYGRRNGKKFSIRKYEGAYRCWRLA